MPREEQHDRADRTERNENASRHTDGAPHLMLSAAGCGLRDHFASAAGTPTVEIISIAVYTRYAALNMPNAGESLPPIMLSNGIWKNAPITLTSRLASIKMNAP